MSEKINFKDLKWSIKQQQLKNWWNKKKREAEDWASKNPELTATILAGAGAGLVYVAKDTYKSHKKAKEEKDRLTKAYDPSLGYYWTLKRPLTSSELLRVEQRHKQGEPYGEIYRSMNLLK